MPMSTQAKHAERHSPESPLRWLREEEVKTFWTDGAICARQVLPLRWIERIAVAVERIIAAPSPVGQHLSAPERGLTHDLYMYTRDEDFRAFVFESPAALLAQQILGAHTVRFFYDQLFVKEPGSPVPTLWHHDITFWPIAGQQICSMWTPLDPVNHAASGLEYIRGSHLWPQRFKAIGVGEGGYPTEMWPRPELESVPDIDSHRDQYDIISWDFEPGDVLLFHPCTLHGSGANTSPTQRRRAFATRWVGDDVVFTGSPDTPTFRATGLKPGDLLGGAAFPVVLSTL